MAYTLSAPCLAQDGNSSTYVPVYMLYMYANTIFHYPSNLCCHTYSRQHLPTFEGCMAHLCESEKERVRAVSPHTAEKVPGMHCECTTITSASSHNPQMHRPLLTGPQPKRSQACIANAPLSQAHPHITQRCTILFLLAQKS